MSVRDDIVEAANMEIGGWSAVEYHPTVTDMDAYFMQAWGGTYASASKSTKSLWCGIFAVYVLRQAGVKVHWGPMSTKAGGWGIVTDAYESSQVRIVNGHSGVQPGDIGYVSAYNHHFIITAVDELFDYTECIDGNADGVTPAGTLGTIKRRKSRRLSQIEAYYQILVDDGSYT
jgi:hypothetical protein